MTEGSSSTRPRNPPHRAPLVGRERELAALRTEMEIGLSGEGRVLLLAGEPGIGKTRTAEELASDAAARGAQVLWGRCHEAEWTPPYWLWVQILRAYAQGSDADDVRADLGDGASDVAHLVPDIAGRLPDLPPPSPLPPEQARFRLFDSVASCFRRGAARRPLLLVLDDLHWADAPSLLLLEFLVREIRSVPVVVLGTYRDIEVGRQHPLARTLAELHRDRRSPRVLLRGLSEPDVARIVEAQSGRAPARALAAAIHRETEGNPFFVSEVVSLLESEGGLVVDPTGSGPVRALPIPESVKEVIGRRLDRLSRECNDVLGVAATIGREFGLPTLARVTEVPSEPLLDLLEEAVSARIVEEEARSVGRYRFSHALTRETLYDELSAARRIRLHRRIGQALETIYRADPDAHLAELAHHFVKAAPGGDIDRAVAYARRAGEHAMALLGFEDAAAHFEAALQIVDLQEPADELVRCELLLALATAQHAASDQRVRATFSQAAALAQRLGASEHLARAALGYAELSGAVWEIDEATRSLLEHALAALGPDDSAIRTRLLVSLALGLLLRDPAHAAELTAESEAMARRLNDPQALATALHARRLEVFYGSDEFDEFLSISAEMVRLAEAAGDRDLEWRARVWENAAHWALGNMATGDAVQRQGDRLAVELRQPSMRVWSPMARVPRAVMSGRFAEADQLLAEALALANPVEMPYLAHWEALQRFAIGRERGQHVKIEAVLQEAIAAAPTEGLSSLQAMLALAYCETGRVGDARQQYEALIEDGFARLRRQREYLQNWYHAFGILAEVCSALGDANRAASLNDFLLPAAGRNLVCGGVWHVAGPADHYLGLLATVLCRWDDAARHFEDALAMNDRMGAPPFLARTQLAYASMLAQRDADGDRAQARVLTDAALATANELGMMRLAAEAAEAPAKLEAGLAADARVGAQRVGLTEREWEVLRLLVAGRSNPEIAEDLFMSPHTARTHVSNVFAKFGVHSRTEAVDYAHRHGLLDSSDPTST